MRECHSLAYESEEYKVSMVNDTLKSKNRWGCLEKFCTCFVRDLQSLKFGYKGMQLRKICSVAMLEE